jgi:DsbC/DsbD-like thiol-disulfide interchange protein
MVKNPTLNGYTWLMRTITLSMLLWLVFVPSAALADSRATVTGALDVSAIQLDSPGRLAVVLDIAPGFHAQSNTPLDEYAIKCELTLNAVPGIEFGQIIYPAGRIEDYPQLGKLSVYTGRAIILVPFKATKDAKLGSVTLSGSVQMQICNDDTCFPPEKTVFSVETKVVPIGTPVEPRNEPLFPKAPATAPAQSQAPPTTHP